MNESDLAVLRRLLDKQAIRECVHDYARGIDRHDEEILRSVFHADAIDNHGDVVLGRDEFAAWANKWHARVTAHHMHSISTHFSDVEGNEAHAVTYVLFTLCRKDGTTVHVGGGRYVDRLLRRGDEWRIILRRLIIDWRLNARSTASARLAGHPHGNWERTDPSYAHLGAS